MRINADGLKRESERVMKKALVFLTLIVALLLCLASCNNEHIHQFGEWSVTQNATSTEDGIKTRYCYCGERQCDVIPATGEVLTDVITVEDGYLVVNGVKTEYQIALSCSHIWQTITTAPTCISDGYDTMTCLLCDKSIKLNETAKLDHSYSSSYSFDNDYHWFNCTSCNAVKEKMVHTPNAYNDCMVCGIPLSATPGIIYDISADETYAEVIGYNGIATRIKIAREYNGLPVKSICEEAFSDNEIITSVIIPDSVTTIGRFAFGGCSNLTSVVLGENVKTIELQAFAFTRLETIHLPKSVTNIELNCLDISTLTSITVDENHPLYASIDGDLYSKDKTIIIKYAVGKEDVVFTIPNHVLKIDNRAFERARNLTTIIIPDGVTSIGYCAFDGCSNLTSIVIPDSITNISDSAFVNCYSLIYTEYENGRYLGNNENPYLALVDISNNKHTSYRVHNRTEIISSHVFEDCSRLVSLVIPNSVTSISDNAFYSVSLTDIYFIGGKAEWDAIDKEHISAGITIHYNYNPDE